MLSLLDLLPAGTELTDDGVPVVGGCRLDQVAAETATPVLVVAEDALRARAREYADGLAARWPRSRVVFASKAFPCTAVQRVMVEEGLGLDVAGGGEILGALKAGVDPRLVILHGNAKLPDEIALAVEHGLGLVVVDGPDDVDRLEAAVPAGRVVDVLVRVIPGVTAETHDSVLTGHDDSKFGLAPADAEALIRRIEASGSLRMQRAPPARRLADPPDRAVRRRRRGGRAAGRVPGLRPGRRPGRALHLVRRTAIRGGVPRHPDRGQPSAPARGRRDHHRAGPQHGGGGGLHRLLGGDRETRQAHVRRRRRRHGRQPRGRPVRPAVRGGHRRPARPRSTTRTTRSASSSAGTARAATSWSATWSCPDRPWETWSSCPPPAPTASRWPTTTTGTGDCPWCSLGTAHGEPSSDARPGRTCCDGTSTR